MVSTAVMPGGVDVPLVVGGVIDGKRKTEANGDNEDGERTAAARGRRRREMVGGERWSAMAGMRRRR